MIIERVQKEEIPSKPVYLSICESLEISEEFLKNEEWQIALRMGRAHGLLQASKEEGVGSEIRTEFANRAFNQFIHLATSVVLLSNQDDDGQTLDGVIEKVKHTKVFENIDPTSVITVAVALSLIDDIYNKPGDNRSLSDDLREMLSTNNNTSEIYKSLLMKTEPSPAPIS